MTHGDHTQDRQNVANEVASTDQSTTARRVLSEVFGIDLGRPGGRPSQYQSDFEGRQLNEMIALVQNSTPSELTSAGEALWSARDAISDAAEELNGHIGDVDWHGDSGAAFKKWGAQLVSNTRALAKFAGEAGTQIHVAGSGLSSVKSSMPPPDNRVDKKTVKQIPVPAQVKGNPEYDAAVQVEGHRQEAINQMTRLASFYSVASSTLASQEPPKFEMMPDVGVPKPAAGQYRDDPRGSARRELGTASSQGSTSHAKGEVPTYVQAELKPHGEIDQLRPPEVTTDIDSAPPVLVTPPVDPTPTPSPNPPGPNTNPTPPYADGFVKTGQNPPPKAFGKTTNPQARGLNREVTASGKTPTNQQAGRTPTTGMGRGAGHPMGHGPNTQGRAGGRGGTSAGRMPMGRSGVSGGTPRAATPAKSSQAGAVRKGGVVGGRPNTGQPSGSSPRVPRGTVIGGRQESAGRPQGSGGKVGQRGVIGAPNPMEKKPQAVQRTPGAPEGVLGEPTDRTKGPRGERAGFTSGGSGLVRGQSDQHDVSEVPTTAQETDGAQSPTPQHRPSQAPPAND